MRDPQLLIVPRTQGKFFQEHAVPKPKNFVPGISYRLRAVVMPEAAGQAPFRSLALKISVFFGHADKSSLIHLSNL